MKLAQRLTQTGNQKMLDEIEKLSAFGRFVMIKSLGGGGVEYCNTKTKAIKSESKTALAARNGG